MKERRALRSIFIVFAVLFAIGGLFLLEGLSEGLAPWFHHLPDEHLWHGAVHGALIGVLFSGSLIAMLWRASGKALLLNFYIIGHLIFIVVMAASSWELFKTKFFVAIMFTVICSILYGLYTNRREVFRPRQPIRYNRPLLLTTLLCMLGLLSPGWNGFVEQLGETGGFFRWGENPALFLTLLYGGYLSASGRSGSREMACIVGITYLFLGVAALTVPNHPGSFGLFGGILSCAGGLLYIGFSRSRRRTESAYTSSI